MYPPKVSRVQVPCCPSGFLKADPNGDYICSQCGTIYTTTDLLNLTNMPTRPAGGVKMVAVTGNTYPVKDELKQLGARWNAQTRVWMVPEHRLIEAQRIVTRGPNPNNPPWSAPGSQTRTRTSEEERFQAYRESAKRQAAAMESRCCWECASAFTEAQVEAQGGSWDEFWCGCQDKPRQSRVTAGTASRSSR